MMGDGGAAQIERVQPSIRRLADVASMAIAASPVVAANVCVALAGAVWWILAVRWAVPDQVGRYVALSGIALFLGEFANMGVGYVWVRYYARYGEDRSKLVCTGFTIATAAALLATAVIALASRLLRISFVPDMPTLFSLVALMALGAVWYTITDNLLLGAGKRSAVFVRALCACAGRLALLVLFARRGTLSATSLALIYSSPGLVLSLGILPQFVARPYPTHHRGLFLSRAQIVSLSKYSLHSYTGNVVTAIVPNVLPVFVTWKLGTVQGARFGVMWSIASLLMLVPVAISLTAFSRAARGEQRADKIVADGVWLMLLVQVPMIVGILLLSPFVVPKLGAAYTAISPLLLAPLLIGVLCVGFTSQVYSRARMIQGGLRLIMSVQGLQTAIVFLCAIALVPPFHLFGAALAWSIGAASAFAITYTWGLAYLHGLHQPDVRHARQGQVPA